MNEDSDLSQLVAAYWQHYHASLAGDNVGDDEWFWAWIEVESAVREPSGYVFELIIALIDAAVDDDALCYVGAGPLEDLVNWHGMMFLDKIEESARKDRAFRKALAGVRISENVPAVAQERLAPFMPPP